MNISSVKKSLQLNLKNIVGWKTKRKIVVFSVDDYGNVRVASQKARETMNRAGLKILNRFDALDSLETRTDLEMLFETLSSFHDRDGNHPVFSAFSVVRNIDFERMSENGYSSYVSEQLPDTFAKLALTDKEAYAGTWEAWEHGISSGIFIPQFHGREHINLKTFTEKLKAKDKELITSLKNRSFTSITDSGYKTISITAAFDFDDFAENEQFAWVIEDGLKQFEQVFGFRSVHFTPPVFNCHPIIHDYLAKNGIRYIDTALTRKQHQGNGTYKREYSYTGKSNNHGQIFIVRNVVFEPSDPRRSDWVQHCLEQIEAAFKWNRPAVISTHRVNFCGHIDQNNRDKGLSALGSILKEIVRRWPEVEFMAADKLGDLILEESK